jgi:hypothetical protein
MTLQKPLPFKQAPAEPVTLLKHEVSFSSVIFIHEPSLKGKCGGGGGDFLSAPV